LKVVKRMDESGEYIDRMTSLAKVNVTTVKMAAEDGNLIELLYFHSHPMLPGRKQGMNRIGVSHVAFTVNDLEAEYERLQAKGVAFNAPPQHSPDGYAKVTFCQDPDGNLIELVEVLSEK
jgi:catechol 2,3-dioxygenase-like lactoylglutathione lyase family enzyme